MMYDLALPFLISAMILTMTTTAHSPVRAWLIGRVTYSGAIPVTERMILMII